MEELIWFWKCPERLVFCIHEQIYLSAISVGKRTWIRLKRSHFEGLEGISLGEHFRIWQPRSYEVNQRRYRPHQSAEIWWIRSQRFKFIASANHCWCNEQRWGGDHGIDSWIQENSHAGSCVAFPSIYVQDRRET